MLSDFEPRNEPIIPLVIRTDMGFGSQARCGAGRSVDFTTAC